MTKSPELRRGPRGRVGWRRALRDAAVYAALCAAIPAFGAQVYRPPPAALVKVNEALRHGQDLLAQHRFNAAMEQFETALQISPSNTEARQGEATAAIASALEETHISGPQAALPVLQRAITLAPQEPELLLDLAIAATSARQFQVADEALRAAILLRPDDAKTIYARARLEVEEQHLPAAERDLEAYLVMKPKDATAYFGLGHVYAMEQRVDQAKAAFERSVVLEPNQTESYYQLGQIALEAQQDTEAKLLFQKVIARAPHHAGALTGLGQIALRAKEYVAAERYLAEAEQSDPGYATPHYFRGLALARLGRKEEAQQEMQRGDSRPHATAPGTNSEGAGPGSDTETKPPGP